VLIRNINKHKCDDQVLRWIIFQANSEHADGKNAYGIEERLQIGVRQSTIRCNILGSEGGECEVVFWDN
jgi:hypothetical protein